MWVKALKLFFAKLYSYFYAGTDPYNGKLRFFSAPDKINRVCHEGIHGYCIQTNSTIHFSRRLRVGLGEVNENCWKPFSLNILNNCECLWPKHIRGMLSILLLIHILTEINTFPTNCRKIKKKWHTHTHNTLTQTRKLFKLLLCYRIFTTFHHYRRYIACSYQYGWWVNVNGSWYVGCCFSKIIHQKYLIEFIKDIF